jgi:ubiquinone/menaquinone biosynthesis C-methylase UbiE
MAEQVTSKPTQEREMTRQAWGSDFFGTLNQLPREAVDLIAHVLETMRTEPTFQGVRRSMLADLGISPNSSVLDAGCGTGAALPDLVALAGPGLRVVGVDPTEAFIYRARERAAALGCTAARYELGDIRDLPYPDEEFDAAFCDKVLLHVGPAESVLTELVRVTRRGGKIGATEWHPYFVISTSRPELAASLNNIFRQALYNYMASANLARYFQSAGLVEIRTHTQLAHTRTLDAHPFWRSFLIAQIPLFVHAGLISEDNGQALAADLEDLDRRGVLSASFIVQSAVGTRPTRGSEA